MCPCRQMWFTFEYGHQLSENQSSYPIVFIWNSSWQIRLEVTNTRERFESSCYQCQSSNRSNENRDHKSCDSFAIQRFKATEDQKLHQKFITINRPNELPNYQIHSNHIFRLLKLKFGYFRAFRSQHPEVVRQSSCKWSPRRIRPYIRCTHRCDSTLLSKQRSRSIEIKKVAMETEFFDY